MWRNRNNRGLSQKNPSSSLSPLTKLSLYSRQVLNCSGLQFSHFVKKKSNKIQSAHLQSWLLLSFK